jgi:hypothetical protein
MLAGLGLACLTLGNWHADPFNQRLRLLQPWVPPGSNKARFNDALFNNAWMPQREDKKHFTPTPHHPLPTSHPEASHQSSQPHHPLLSTPLVRFNAVSFCVDSVTCNICCCCYYSPWGAATAHGTLVVDVLLHAAARHAGLEAVPASSRGT